VTSEDDGALGLPSRSMCTIQKLAEPSLCPVGPGNWAPRTRTDFVICTWKSRHSTRKVKPRLKPSSSRMSSGQGQLIRRLKTGELLPTFKWELPSRTLFPVGRPCCPSRKFFFERKRFRKCFSLGIILGAPGCGFPPSDPGAWPWKLAPDRMPDRSPFPPGLTEHPWPGAVCGNVPRPSPIRHPHKSGFM